MHFSDFLILLTLFLKAAWEREPKGSVGSRSVRSTLPERAVLTSSISCKRLSSGLALQPLRGDRQKPAGLRVIRALCSQITFHSPLPNSLMWGCQNYIFVKALFKKILKNIYDHFACTYFYVHVLHVLHVCLVPEQVREAVGFPETRVIDGWSCHVGDGN